MTHIKGYRFHQLIFGSLRNRFLTINSAFCAKSSTVQSRLSSLSRLPISVGIYGKNCNEESLTNRLISLALAVMFRIFTVLPRIQLSEYYWNFQFKMFPSPNHLVTFCRRIQIVLTELYSG
jgi:hypothetical protein